MSEKDSAAKLFFSKEEIASDLLNGVLCGGGRVFTPRQMNLASPDQDEVEEESGRLISESRHRDICFRPCVLRNGRRFRMIVGIEAQSYRDGDIFMRAKGYDEGELRRQSRRERKRERRRGRWLRKRLVPAFTIVLYLGEGAWNPPLTMEDVLGDVPEFMKAYVPSYRMIFVNLRELPEKVRKKFCTELKFVVDCLCLSRNPAALKKYLHENMPRHLSYEARMFLKAYINLDLKTDEKEKKMSRNVMKEVEKLWVKDGIAIGLKKAAKMEERGERRGRTEGMKEGQLRQMLSTIKNALDKGYSEQEIRNFMNLSANRYSQIISRHF